ncbi:helix-turn-helix transcriptional regulator [Catenulispora subtropica]|uniref:Transcriptional regulator, XRE family n=1 Tax=Catenulispora subtropica TaxID=450798 RepID=A0ABN2T833_9ACTN
MREQAVRRCSVCSAVLSRYNATERCGACSRSPQLPPADDLWSTAQAQQALRGWDVGAALALYRRHTGVTQVRIAAAVGIDQSEVSRLQRGEKKIRDRQQALMWIRVLGVPDDLLPVMPAGQGRPDLSSTLWLPTLADTLSAVGEMTGADINSRIGEAAEVDAAPLTDALIAWANVAPNGESAHRDRPGRQIGMADVQTLSIMSQAFADADHRLGGGHARSTLAHYLNSVAIPLALHSSYTDHVGRQLLAEIARLSDVAGFMAFDAGHQLTGRHYLVHALRLAAAGGNPVLSAHILTDLAMQAIYVGQTSPAVDAAHAAIAAARRGNSPSTLARCYAIAARAAAAAGDAAASDKHLNQAERVLDNRGHGEEPAWISFFSTRQLTVESMYASEALGRSTYVQRHADTAQLDHAAGDAMPRRDVLAKSTLALSYLTDERVDIERACAVMTECIPLIGGLTSARALAAVKRTRQRLADFSDSASVKELEEAFALSGQADV